jgi:hypothetical protein
MMGNRLSCVICVVVSIFCLAENSLSQTAPTQEVDIVKGMLSKQGNRYLFYPDSSNKDIAPIHLKEERYKLEDFLGLQLELIIHKESGDKIVRFVDEYRLIILDTTLRNLGPYLQPEIVSVFLIYDPVDGRLGLSRSLSFGSGVFYTFLQVSPKFKMEEHVGFYVDADVATMRNIKPQSGYLINLKIGYPPPDTLSEKESDLLYANKFAKIRRDYYFQDRQKVA